MKRSNQTPSIAIQRMPFMCAILLLAGIVFPVIIQAPMGLYTSSARVSEPIIERAPVTFMDVTAQVGLDQYNSNSVAWGDFNNDTYQDLLVSGTRLFRNNGPPGWDFTEVSGSAGLMTGPSGGIWGDWDNDGWQDIYVSNYRIRANYLYLNDGDGTFTEVAEERGAAGVYDPDRYHDTTAGSYYGQSDWGPTWGHTIGSAWADYDNDGDLDLITAGKSPYEAEGQGDYHLWLFSNNGSGSNYLELSLRGPSPTGLPSEHGLP